MDPDTSQQGRGLSPEQLEQAKVLIRQAGRRARQQLPGILEHQFLLQLHQLLEDFDAELSYTRDDDGIHVRLAGRELLGGAGFFDRAELREALVEVGVLQWEPGGTPEIYLLCQERAAQASGPGGPTWNRDYIAQLAQRGLVLLPSRPPGDRDEWDPHGAPMLAPLPHAEGGDQWPAGTLICWAHSRRPELPGSGLLAGPGLSGKLGML